MATAGNSRSTQILLDVSDDVLPIRDEEQPICEEWLRSVGFLVPGEEQEVWKAIVQNWERFLKATRTKIMGSGASRRLVQKHGRQEAQDEETLEDMGLELNDEDEEDIVDIGLAVDPSPSLFMDDDDPSDLIQGFLTRLIMDESAVARKNPLLWWTAILVRSAISGGEEKDFISRGTISMNMLPPDVDIRGRVEAIRHYSKVFVLDKAFTGWRTGRPGREVWAEEIAQELLTVDTEWLNNENGRRPDDRLDRRTCLSPAWKRILEHLEQEGATWLGQKEGTTMGEIGRLLSSLRGVSD
ncbi:hypothetical protein FDECE_17114 [Fusarium decemcellulare]|nr:hypothetical protein FDECE_17114 [Fusarium decemcellulare]